MLKFVDVLYIFEKIIIKYPIYFVIFGIFCFWKWIISNNNNEFLNILFQQINKKLTVKLNNKWVIIIILSRHI